MKQKNKLFGYRRIAMQIKNVFGLKINKDVVRRVLKSHYKPTNNDENFLGDDRYGFMV